MNTKIQFFSRMNEAVSSRNITKLESIIEELNDLLLLLPRDFKNKQMKVIDKLKKRTGQIENSRQVETRQCNKKLIVIETITNYGDPVKEYLAKIFKECGYQICTLGEKKKYSDYWLEFEEGNLETEKESQIVDTKYILGSIRRDLPGFIENATETELNSCIKSYSKRYLKVFRNCSKFFQSNKSEIHLTIIWGGLFLEAIAIRNACKSLGVDCFATEYSFDRNKIYFDPVGVIGNMHSFSKPIVLPAMTADKKKIILDWVYAFDHSKSKVTKTQDGIARAVELVDSSKKNVLLLAQCNVDTVITYDNPLFEDALSAYESITEYAFTLPHVNLIVKQHPGDLQANKDRIASVCTRYNCSLVDDNSNISVYDLIDVCDVGITINSQSGLEMLLRQKNVLCLGNSFYTNNGFGLSALNFSSWQIAFDNLLSEEPNFSYDDLLNYTYHYLFEYLVPFNNSEKCKQHIVVSDNYIEEKRKRLLVVHPSGCTGGSGYYLQELAKNLISYGWQVIVFCEGTTRLSIDGIRWYRIAFEGNRLAKFLRNVISEFDPTHILQVGVRTKSMRTALESFLLAENATFIVQAEDDEETMFLKEYPSADLELLKFLDKPEVSVNDISLFLKKLNIEETVLIFNNPEQYRWVEPVMRILCYRIADAHSSIWFPMAERLKQKFNKRSFILPPVADWQQLASRPNTISKSELFNKYNIRQDTFVVFINGTIYPYSDEFNVFVDSIKLVSKWCDQRISLVIAGRIDAQAKNYATQQLKGLSFFRSLKTPPEDDYLAMIDYADVCAAPGLNDTFNKYRMSSRLVKVILKKRPLLTFKTGFGDSLCDYYHGVFARFDSAHEYAKLILLFRNQLLVRKMTNNAFNEIGHYFDSSIVAKNFDLFFRYTAGLSKDLVPQYDHLNDDADASAIKKFLNENLYRQFMLTPFDMMSEDSVIEIINKCDVSFVRSEVLAFIGSCIYPKNIYFREVLLNYAVDNGLWDAAYSRLKDTGAKARPEDSEGIYKTALVYFNVGDLDASFRVLRDSIFRFPNLGKLKNLLLSVCYNINEKGLHQQDEVNAFVLGNLENLVKCNGRVDYGLFWVMNAFLDSMSIANASARLSSAFDMKNLLNENVRQDNNKINSLIKMRFLGSAHSLIDSKESYSEKEVEKHYDSLFFLKRSNFDPFFKIFFHILEHNYRFQENEICYLNGQYHSVSAYSQGVVVYVSHIFFQRVSSNHKLTKQVDSYSHPVKVFKTLIEQCIARGFPIALRYQFHNNRIDTRRFIDSWIHISHHTCSLDLSNTFKQLHIKQASLSGFVFFDTNGYSGWASLADLKPEDLRRVPVDNETFTSLQERFLKSRASKYLQRSERFFVENYVFCPLQTVNDNVSNLSIYTGIEVVKKVIQVYRETDVCVVIKRHPLCRHYLVSEFLAEVGLEKNVLISDANIHDLISGAYAIYTVNSGVGLEALLHKKPVFTFGRSEYMVCTHFIEDLNELQHFNEYNFSEKMELIERYFSLLYHKHLVDVDSDSFVVDGVDKVFSYINARFGAIA